MNMKVLGNRIPDPSRPGGIHLFSCESLFSDSSLKPSTSQISRRRSSPASSISCPPRLPVRDPVPPASRPRRPGPPRFTLLPGMRLSLWRGKVGQDAAQDRSNQPGDTVPKVRCSRTIRPPVLHGMRKQTGNILSAVRCAARSGDPLLCQMRIYCSHTVMMGKPFMPTPPVFTKTGLRIVLFVLIGIKYYANILLEREIRLWE